jgi:hypothetical protein
MSALVKSGRSANVRFAPEADIRATIFELGCLMANRLFFQYRPCLAAA